MIGVFDSGYGGLTVLRRLVDKFPKYDFVYLADTKNTPYGCRNPEEIYQLTISSVEQLFATGCQVVLLACNTASAIALRQLQQKWLPTAHPDKRVLGVLVPMVEEVTGLAWHEDGQVTDSRPRNIGLLATEQTVISGAFEREICKRDPQIQLINQACPKLAGVIEDGANPENLKIIIKEYITTLKNQSGVLLDAVLLGCTHYPIAEKHIVAELDPRTKLFCQPSAVASALQDYLARHTEFLFTKNGQRIFLTTGDTEIVSRRGSDIFGELIEFQKVTC